MSENYWDTEHSGDEGSGGIVALCQISSAFKVYASGVTPTKSVFLFDATTKDAQAKKAKKLSEEHGGAKIDKGVVIIARKDGAKVKGEDATWKDDRVFFVADFTDGWKAVVKPALTKLNLQPGESWLRLGFKDDPYGSKELDQDGKERTRKIAYPAKAYKSKAEAMADVKANSNGSNASTTTADDSTPPDWDADAWANASAKIRKALAEGKKTAAELAAGYKVPVEYITALE